MITPLEIARGLKLETVLDSYSRLYPKYGNKSVKKAFARVLSMRSRRHRDPDERIEVVVMMDWPATDHNKCYYDCSTNKYSFLFRAWTELANIPVSEETLRHMTRADFMAHFLWEMTFNGDEGESKKMGKKLVASVKEAKKEFKRIAAAAKRAKKGN